MLVLEKWYCVEWLLLVEQVVCCDDVLLFGDDLVFDVNLLVCQWIGLVCDIVGCIDVGCICLQEVVDCYVVFDCEFGVLCKFDVWMYVDFYQYDVGWQYVVV